MNMPTWEGQRERIEGGIQAMDGLWYKEIVICVVCGKKVNHSPRGYACCGMEMDVVEWLRLMALTKGPAATDVEIASMKQQIEQHIHEVDWSRAVEVAKKTIEALENLLTEYTRYIRNAAQESRLQVERADELAADIQVKSQALKDAVSLIETGAVGDGKRFRPRIGLDFLGMLRRAAD